MDSIPRAAAVSDALCIVEVWRRYYKSSTALPPFVLPWLLAPAAAHRAPSTAHPRLTMTRTHRGSTVGAFSSVALDARRGAHKLEQASRVISRRRLSSERCRLGVLAQPLGQHEVRGELDSR